LVIGILIIAGMGYQFLIKEKPIACTMEAKQCLDGSYVGRVGPKCEFAACPEVSFRKVMIYYYNPENDKDETGNIKCSRDGLMAVEREIPITKTPIQDTINLLLKGEDSAEYPLEGFSLVEVNLKENGTLILKFNDTLNKTTGGACRVGILWFQIEATAKQFPEVKEVKFLPEELFQP